MFEKDADEAIELMQQFIGNDINVFKYLHNTPKQEIAEKIVKEGFEFEKYLEHTTDLISGVDLVQLKYFKYRRCSYGNFTVIIQIGKELVEKYSNNLPGTQYHFTEILTIQAPRMSNDNEPIYMLPSQYVKGYFDQVACFGHLNPVFDPHFDSPVFQENLQQLILKIQDES